MAVKAKESQAIVFIKEIRNGIVILEDGSMRTLLMASSLNFALKSAEEQEAIITQYQDFLNSLDFSIQFFVQSRRLNISPYIDSLVKAEKNQLNELLKVQTREYIEFVKDFVNLTEIVAKTFYVVIPYTPPVFREEAKNGVLGPEISGILGKITGGKKIENGTQENKFEEYKSQIQQRTEAVAQGLARCGIRTVALNTEELIELFYKLYNPGELAKGGIVAIEE